MPTHPRRRHALVGLLAVLGTIPVLVGPASADPPPVEVTVSVDHPKLVIELDRDGNPLAPPTLTYEVTVMNHSDEVANVPEVVDELPAGLLHPQGRVVHLPVGDLGASGAWRGAFTVEVDRRALGGPVVSNAASALSSDGSRVSSAPVLTDVSVISSVTVDRPTAAPAPAPAPAPAAPAPARKAAPATRPRPRAAATEVLGATYTRDATGAVVASVPGAGSLARTGPNLVPLALLGAALVAVGTAVIRRTPA